MQDIISFVQSHARSKREDLAGEVLALVLREEPGQAVIRQLLEIPALAGAEIEVVTQRMSAGCIPDIHLIQQGQTIGLLELKFWASLTPHQTSGRYFDVAPDIVFIVPNERISAIKEELSPIATNRSLKMLSWETLLNRLDEASVEPKTRDEWLFTGALQHLKEFCNVIEQEHFVPFTHEQLCNPLQDTSTQHLVWLTREAIESAEASEVIKASGRLGAGFDSFFFYGRMSSFLASESGWVIGPMLGRTTPLWGHYGCNFTAETRPSCFRAALSMMVAARWGMTSSFLC